MRVLLIEDDAATAQSIELMLKSENFNVYVTDLGEEGIDLGKLYDYDIILLDLNLPDMSGYEVLRILTYLLGGCVPMLRRTNTLPTPTRNNASGCTTCTTRQTHWSAPRAGGMLPKNCRRRLKRCCLSVAARQCMAHGLAGSSGTATRRWPLRNGCRCPCRLTQSCAACAARPNERRVRREVEMDEELYDPDCSACERAQEDYAALERVADDLSALVQRLAMQEYSAVQDKIYGALRNQNWGRRLLSAVLMHGTASVSHIGQIGRASCRE